MLQGKDAAIEVAGKRYDIVIKENYDGYWRVYAIVPTNPLTGLSYLGGGSDITTALADAIDTLTSAEVL